MALGGTSNVARCVRCREKPNVCSGISYENNQGPRSLAAVGRMESCCPFCSRHDYTPKTHRSIKQVLKKYYHQWKQRGAIAPSSRFLARSITEHIKPSDGVLEIGAGAGAFTQALAEKVPGRRLHVVEIDADHERALRAYTPNVYVTDALGFLSSPPCDLEGFKVISGLPLLNFDLSFRKNLFTELLLEARVASVRQFTYSPRRLVTREWLAEKGLRGRRVDFVVRNLPPASVWEYSRTDG